MERVFFSLNSLHCDSLNNVIKHFLGKSSDNVAMCIAQKLLCDKYKLAKVLMFTLRFKCFHIVDRDYGLTSFLRNFWLIIFVAGTLYLNLFYT